MATKAQSKKTIAKRKELYDKDTDKKQKKNSQEEKDNEKITPAKLAENEQMEKHKETSKFFHCTETSIKEKKRCSICGKPLVSENYWKSYAYCNIGRMDADGKINCSSCKACSQSLFDYYFKMSNGNYEYAMERTCLDLNFYWDIENFKEAKQIFENNNRRLHILSEYIASVGRMRTKSLGLTYWDSPTIQFRDITVVQSQNIGFENLLSPNDNYMIKDGWDTPLEYDQETTTARKKVIKIYRYDPFENENDEDKPCLYKDLLSMMEDGMEDDYVKCRAALVVVRSFNKIENWTNEIARLDREKDFDNSEAALKTISHLSKLIKEERTSITSFSKDHGFAQKYAQNKAKGSGSLSGVMNQMSEKQYEYGILNMYDIETSESMMQSAEMSAKAIFNQLNISGNETYEIMRKQREELVQNRKELKKALEDLRKMNYKYEAERLKLKQYKDGLRENDDD